MTATTSEAAPQPAKSLLRRVIGWNVRASAAFDRLLPDIYRLDGNTDFVDSFAPAHIDAALEGRKGLNVYDLGGGKNPFLTAAQKADGEFRYIGLDIDAAELAAAPPGVYDETVTADICAYDGAADADIVICRTLLEHVKDNRLAFRSFARLLKPGGIAVLFVPSRNAVFARINLLLPQTLKQKILYAIYPATERDQGFQAYYNRCTPKAFETLARENGLTVEYRRLYMCSLYFDFCLPAHVAWRLWQLAFRTVAGDQAAETFAMVLRKPE